MNARTPGSRKQNGYVVAAVLARWLLGACFIYMGLNKALHPIDFLKLVRQYDWVQNHVLLNVIAAGLPWFEMLCGLLLMLGVAVRGAALVLVGMLVVFTGIVLQRAWGIHVASGLAFCAIKFDCGCGTGEVWICWKLVENSMLLLLSLALLFGRSQVWCWRFGLLTDDQSAGAA
jgi:uncharacterized membrane protein YphA (DoxX/SURF4 family)